MASQTVVSRISGFAAQMVIAAVLAPEQVGLIALVTSITIISRHLSTPGTEEVLLTKKHRLRRWLNAAFWFNLANGLLGAAVLAVTAVVVVKLAQFMGNDAYGDPLVLKMALIMALASPLSAVQLVPLTVLQAQLRFKEVSIIYTFEALGTHILTIALALLGLGAYSFVLPLPVVAAVKLGVLWYLARPRIGMRLSLHRWGELTGSTFWVLSRRILRTARDHGDQIILGVMYSDAAMNGHYYFAFLLSSQVVRVMCDNLQKVLLPVLNTIRDDLERLENATIRTCRVLAAVIMPFLLCQIVLTGPAIRLVFGTVWSPAIPLVQLLSLAPVLYATTFPMAAMISAMGRFKAAFYLSVANLVMFFAIVTPMAAVWEAEGAAGGVAVWGWAASILTGIVAFRSLRGARIVFAVVARALAAVALASIIPGLMVLFIPKGTAFAIVKLGIGIPALMIVYFMIMKRIDPDAIEMLRERVWAKFRAIFACRNGKPIVEPPELAGASKLLE